jgi:protein-disulfide isomerase
MKRRSISFAGSLLLACLCASATTLAQSPADIEALRAEMAALRAAQESMAKDVEAIKQLLQQAMAPHPAPAGAAAAAAGMPAANVSPLKVAGRPTKGSASARLTFIEYSDYECPFCAQYFLQVYPQINRDYVLTNKIKYVFKNYPIEQIHARAFRAHVAAACAGDQNRFWEMHDKLFGDQKGLTNDRYVEHARELGMDAAKFRTCLDGAAHEPMIREDIDEAVKGGVRGTPVFVLAIADPKADTVTPSRVIVGAQPFEAFRDAIESLLAQANAQPPVR